LHGAYICGKASDGGRLARLLRPLRFGRKIISSICCFLCWDLDFKLDRYSYLQAATTRRVNRLLVSSVPVDFDHARVDTKPS
jgi:hypothetical protein